MSEKDADGNQLVMCGRWTYKWTGERPLEVGESVHVPFGRGNRLMTVTAVGSDYGGPVKKVLGRSVRTGA